MKKKTPRESGVKRVHKYYYSHPPNTRFSSPLQAPPSRHRKVRRDRPYEDMYSALSLKKRNRVNEKVIWAVIRLTNDDGEAPPDAWLFLKERARQLIIELEEFGFTKASRRFRQAVTDKV